MRFTSRLLLFLLPVLSDCVCCSTGSAGGGGYGHGVAVRWAFRNNAAPATFAAAAATVAAAAAAAAPRIGCAVGRGKGHCVPANLRGTAALRVSETVAPPLRYILFAGARTRARIHEEEGQGIRRREWEMPDGRP